MTGPTNGKNWLTFGGDLVPNMDSGSLFSSLTIAEWGILEDLLAFFLQSLAAFHKTCQND